MHVVDPHLWCPFEDGTALSLWDSADRNREVVTAMSPGDADGFARYEQLFARIRKALRTEPQDTWVGDSPDRPGLEELLGHDAELIEIMFEEPIASVVERHVRDERLRIALHGQGLIGTWAGPRDRGTAAIHAMHSMGTIEGRPGAWGYVQGGMGTISFALAGAAEAAESSSGETRGSPGSSPARRSCWTMEPASPHGPSCRTPILVPRSRSASRARRRAFADRVRAWRMEGPVLKINCGLSRLPAFTAAGPGDTPHRAMVTIAGTIDETQAAFERSRAVNRLPDGLSCTSTRRTTRRLRLTASTS